MTSTAGAYLAIALVIVLSPLLTVFAPKLFGVLGVAALTAAGIYYTVAGSTAFTETTAAIYFVGAFVLAGLIAVFRLFDRNQE